MQPVFVVEGGTGVGRVVQHFLESSNFVVRMLSIESDVAQRAERALPSIFIIDALALGHSGLELCGRLRAIRSLSRTPVVLVALEASEEDRIFGLESGADDYITGLDSPREFVARVRAVIRRFERVSGLQSAVSLGVLPPLAAMTTALRTGDIELDPYAKRILVRGDEVEITNLEFRLMYYLTFHRSRVFSRDELLDAVWGAQYASPRCVDACVRRLRRKIEPNQTRPTYLKTVRGAGYCLAS